MSQLENSVEPIQVLYLVTLELSLMAAIIGAAATGKNPLELLQVKE